MFTGNIFDRFKEALGDLKLPDNPQDALKDVNEVATGEGNLSDKLTALKDRFLPSSDKEDNEDD